MKTLKPSPNLKVNQNKNSIELDFKINRLIEQDAIIDSRQEEIKILELKHKLLLMKRLKQLHELGCDDIGNEFYQRFGVSYMKVQL